jgi:hypothetical protein
MFTDVSPVSRRLFGVDWLDSSTIVAGHNESFVTIITDSKRDGHPDRYRQIYHRLSISRNRGKSSYILNRSKIQINLKRTSVTHTVV